MQRYLFLASTVITMAPPALAQSVETSLHTNVTPLQHGGIFHVATGTWTRNVPQAVNLGPDIIYNNTAINLETGVFFSGGISSQTSSFELADAGIIPSSTNTVPGNRDNYNVNCVEIAYCLGDDSVATGPLNVELQLLNQYTTCMDPANGKLLGTIVVSGLPGYDPLATPSGYFDCWTVEVDLSGGSEICLRGDGDGAYDGIIDLDQFGLSQEYDPGATGGYVGAVSVGPMVTGDRDWTAAAAGGPYGFGGGGGTYYGPAETCVPMAGGENSSGFEQEDAHWIGDRPATAQVGGCFFFGGYLNPFGCSADGAQPGQIPNTGHYAIIKADSSNNCLETGSGAGPAVAFCDPANPNSTQFPAILEATTLASNVGTGLHIAVRQGPPSQFGYVLIGTAAETVAPAVLSDGLFCLAVGNGNEFGRYNFGVQTNSLGQFDAAGIFQNMVGSATSAGGEGFDVPSSIPISGSPTIRPGSTWHFQVWYRDTASGIGQSNLSNGISVTF